MLDTISGSSAPSGDNGYNTTSDGKTFSDYSAYPAQATAAGRYQLSQAAWTAQQQSLGLSDFSPSSQDLAAWNLAQFTYYANTGGDLLSALRSGVPTTIAGVGSSLRTQWPSLPGGVISTPNGSVSAFGTRFSANLARSQTLTELGSNSIGVSDISASTVTNASSIPSGVYVPKK